MICPIACGECCEQYWYQAFYIDKHPGLPCHHLGRKGCRLSREERPESCNNFLCMKAEEEIRHASTMP